MKSRMHFGFLLSFLLSFLVVQSSATAESMDVLGLWSVDQITDSSNKIVSIDNDAAEKVTETHSDSKHYENGLSLVLNTEKMRSILGSKKSAKPSAENTESNISQISIPLPDGSIIDLDLIEDQVLTTSLAEKYPEIQTFKVIANDNVFSGKVDLTSSGFHAMLQMLDGEIIFIDPVDFAAEKYISYKKSAQKQTSDRSFSCGVTEQQNRLMQKFSGRENISHGIASRAIAGRTTESLLHYRIAIATTGEYAAKHGGTVTGVMSAITTTLSRVNQILERDLGIHLDLVENNDLLINTDANSDPFTKDDISDLLSQNQEYIDSVIGTDNYDIGHLFAGSGGGIAAVASICNQYRKAQGVSGTSNPINDSFDLDFVAHEIGHQLGATHTFNSSQGLCSGNTRSAQTAFEPGSGSSIMSYAGYCGLDNLQSNADAMYHIGSIEQISDFTSNGRGNVCGTQRSFDNKPPIADAGNDFTIPSRTPFELKGTAQDVDGDPLIYAWEQIDSGETSLEYDDKGDNALFRVNVPNISSVRVFPQLQDILSNSTSRGEKLPEHERVMNFSFVAQDGMNVAQSDEMKINVARTGSRFALNLPKSQYTLGESYQIFWNVAATDKSPVSCQNVDLYLSTNGGQTFPTVIEKNLPNKGDAWVLIPATVQKTNESRFKLKCSDNVFFAVSQRNFVLTDKTTQVTFKHADEDQSEANLKDTDLNAVVTNNEVSAVSSNDSTSTSQGSSGGGLINYWFLLLSCVLLMKRRLNLLQ
ncbi:reprolysin-like metallopeptidase [Cocleimonas flava]|uniref:Reprolysin-like metallo-peptidase family M12B n=1 Tax=Cocleimonas flava TaxID=634765 RepID=A0A4R1F751_9GAMM|nr:zinc-dependent metalloprotease family protein [Cocleimonas flava]TCJ88462.1 reprolysin-like metallo-peptidase family M12B [Cocleimonas flava]